jgi:hypothetical protein
MLREKTHRLADVVSREGVSGGLQAIRKYVGTRAMESIYSSVGGQLISSAISRAELIERGGSDYPIYTYGEDNDLIFPLPKGNARKQWEQAFDVKVRVRSDIASRARDHGSRPAYRIRTPAEFFCVIPNVTLFGPKVIPRTKNKRILKADAGNVDRLLNNAVTSTLVADGLIQSMRNLGYINSFRSTDHLIISHAINLAPVHGYDFGHWMLEDLPKLRAAKIYEQQTGFRPKIIIHENPPNWVRDSLRLFGYGESDLIESNGTPLKVESLVQPIHKPIRLIEGEPSPENYHWVRKEMKQNTDWTRYKDEFSDRVYISRARMDKRRVVNEQEILESIMPFGFEPYQPETMSFSEQIALFEGASIVVGPLGAALSNLIYSSDAHVIELLPHDHVLLTWFEVMHSLGHDYSYVQGLPTSTENNTQQRPNQDLGDFYRGRDNNFRVDINTLKKAIEDLSSVESR